MLFSLIETAKENGLDPYRYLTWMLNEAHKRTERDPGWVSSLIPMAAPPQCKADSN